MNGKYLVDDRPDHPAEESKAEWKAVLAVQENYNGKTQCFRRMRTDSNVLADFRGILERDEADVKQKCE